MKTQFFYSTTLDQYGHLLIGKCNPLLWQGEDGLVQKIDANRYRMAMTEYLGGSVDLKFIADLVVTVGLFLNKEAKFSDLKMALANVLE